MSAALLSILLNHPDEWPAVADQIHCEMFPADLQPVFSAYESMARKGLKPDAVMVAEAIGQNEHAQDALQGVVDHFASAHSLEGHVTALVEGWRETEREKIGRKLASGYPADKAIEELTALQTGPTRGATAAEIRAALWNEVVECAEKDFIGLSTGLKDLDERLGGLRPGNLCVIAARPRMGKTALAQNIISAQTSRVAFFSLEMGMVELGQRWLATAGIDYGKVRHPKRFNGDLSPISDSMHAIPDNCTVFDRGGQRIDEIEANAYRMKASGGLDMVVIDYMQLVRWGGSEYETVSEVSRRLKSLAKNLDVVVIALAQLNREVDKRAIPKPQLSDLKESGQIEQDADQVIFVYRPEVYDMDGDDLLIIGKNRGGMAGDVRVTWQGKHQRFVNAAHVWGEAA